MTSIRTALLCALALSAVGVASAATERERAAPNSDSVEAAIAANEANAVIARQQYQQYFAQAYQQFPEIPAGVLEAIAYTKTHWNNVQGNALYDDHHAAARIVGVMGLYRGQRGFQDQVGDAARLLNVSTDAVIRDQRLNILGAAALLAQDLRAQGLEKAAPEAITQALGNAMGLLAQTAKATIAAHIEESFAYSVLYTLNRGSDDHGVRIKARPIAFEKAFTVATLVAQRAPFVALDVQKDRVEVGSLKLDPITETLVDSSAAKAGVEKSTDYGPALYQQSPFEAARTTGNPTHVSIHQMEGFYQGSISTFLTSPDEVSAHYLIRDSDGQVTQMVREARRANHTFRNNEYTLGIEQEGFKGQSNWYSNATYNSVIAIVKNMCARWTIPCTSVYTGPATDTESVQASSLRIKGHQHYSGQGGNRSDPGRFFNWTRFASGISGGAPVGTTVLDSFESGEGHFDMDPTASGSTLGIATTSTAERNSARFKNGAWSEQIGLRDNTASNSDWFVRFLSGGGSPAANTSLQKAGGRVGFWVFTAAPGVSVQMAVDDSDGTEQSSAIAVPANVWTFVEWKLDDQAQWDPWAGASNGTITASSVTLDSIFIKRAQNTNDVFVYLDDVSFRIQ
jgi:N-acetyl-anhydromuramyl-L-alanine amidase AmpD